MFQGAVSSRIAQATGLFPFFNRRKFHNPPGSPQSTGQLTDLIGYIARQACRPLPQQLPSEHAIPQNLARIELAAAGPHSITWLGHAGFCMQLGGRRIVIDPFLANRASPLSFAGPRRFVHAPLSITDLEPFDTLVISHNHYDHLCWHTLKQIKNPANIEVVCPTGLAKWFRRRGFTRVTELGWHQSTPQGAVSITACPAIHHSRRGLFDANASLWAAYLFEFEGYKIYFGGDSAMGPVFRQTGAKYGPIDLALIGIGAYAPRKLLRSVHACPEEAIEMAQAIGARNVLGMHWGTIELSEEEAFEPARRFKAAGLKAGYQPNELWLPAMGASLPLNITSEQQMPELEAAVS